LKAVEGGEGRRREPRRLLVTVQFGLEQLEKKTDGWN
jgi:hypothetical protein